MNLPAVNPNAAAFPSSGVLSPRLARALGRDIATLQASTTVQVARIDAAVQRREAIADGISALAGRAMQHVTLVSQAEVNLAMLVPHASGRLSAIADAHSLAMASVVMDGAHALSRLA